jgi:hypothetical protein
MLYDSVLLYDSVFASPQFACSPSNAAQQRYALYRVDLMTFGLTFNPRRTDRGTRPASGGCCRFSVEVMPR